MTDIPATRRETSLSVTVKQTSADAKLRTADDRLKFATDSTTQHQWGDLRRRSNKIDIVKDAFKANDYVPGVVKPRFPTSHITCKMEIDNYVGEEESLSVVLLALSHENFLKATYDLTEVHLMPVEDYDVFHRDVDMPMIEDNLEYIRNSAEQRRKEGTLYCLHKRVGAATKGEERETGYDSTPVFMAAKLLTTGGFRRQRRGSKWARRRFLHGAQSIYWVPVFPPSSPGQRASKRNVARLLANGPLALERFSSMLRKLHK
ncbi:hypothetical protein DFH11DRAFT_1744350 [Phellopilus nigrolimitatus]|nr:hypothetical protein DFH11DRAFT_1744350 [Phellopilus nigrolimitatus]